MKQKQFEVLKKFCRYFKFNYTNNKHGDGSKTIKDCCVVEARKDNIFECNKNDCFIVKGLKEANSEVEK